MKPYKLPLSVKLNQLGEASIVEPDGWPIAEHLAPDRAHALARLANMEAELLKAWFRRRRYRPNYPRDQKYKTKPMKSPPQTSPTAKHSKLPWNTLVSDIFDDDGLLVASVSTGTANAELIAHRVNNYESLLRVAQHVEGLWNGELYYSNNSIRAIVDMAIKAVREAAATSQRKV